MEAGNLIRIGSWKFFRESTPTPAQLPSISCSIRIMILEGKSFERNEFAQPFARLEKDITNGEAKNEARLIDTAITKECTKFIRQEKERLAALDKPVFPFVRYKNSFNYFTKNGNIQIIIILDSTENQCT
jgi:hypothetical protein